MPTLLSPPSVPAEGEGEGEANRIVEARAGAHSWAEGSARRSSAELDSDVALAEGPSGNGGGTTRMTALFPLPAIASSARSSEKTGSQSIARFHFLMPRERFSRHLIPRRPIRST